MEVILLERVEKLGRIGDVVKVKPGFARNYLLPQKKALRATKGNLAVFERQREAIEAANLEAKAAAEAQAGRMRDVHVILVRQAGESGQLYGSVTARDIAEAVTEAGFAVNRSQVAIDLPIKMLGLETVRIRLHPEVTVNVTVNTARSLAEGEMQRQRGGMVSSLSDEDEDEEQDEDQGQAIAAAEPAEDAGAA